MTNLNKEEIDFLVAMAGWLFADGMVNFTYEDEINFEKISKKWKSKYWTDKCHNCKHWMEDFLGFLPARCALEIITLNLKSWCRWEVKE